MALVADAHLLANANVFIHQSDSDGFQLFTGKSIKPSTGKCWLQPTESHTGGTQCFVLKPSCNSMVGGGHIEP